jgi:hypothetical protein
VLFRPASALADLPQSCGPYFRIVDWNVSGADKNWNRGKDAEVADFIVSHVTSYGANVITLQEVTAASLGDIEGALPGWDCQYHQFSNVYEDVDDKFVDDNIAVCVDGTADSSYWKRLADVDPNELPDDRPPLYWWGYVQVEYGGVLITSVHTRSYWNDQHVTELHEDVKTGIISGDYNFEYPETNPNVPENPDFDPSVPDWYQTDLDREWTIDGYERDADGNLILDENGNKMPWEKKIDHVLTVEKPQQIDGFPGADGDDNPPPPLEPFHSAHRVLLGELTFDETPSIAAAITNTVQPIEVDGSCTASVEFQITLHHYCCLDPDNCSASATWAFASYTSNEPDDSTGDGSTIDDCVVNPDGQGFCARGERMGRSTAGLVFKRPPATGRCFTGGGRQRFPGVFPAAPCSIRPGTHVGLSGVASCQCHRMVLGEMIPAGGQAGSMIRRHSVCLRRSRLSSRDHSHTRQHQHHGEGEAQGALRQAVGQPCPDLGEGNGGDGQGEGRRQVDQAEAGAALAEPLAALEQIDGSTAHRRHHQYRRGVTHAAAQGNASPMAGRKEAEASAGILLRVPSTSRGHPVEREKQRRLSVDAGEVRRARRHPLEIFSTGAALSALPPTARLRGRGRSMMH